MNWSMMPQLAPTNSFSDALAEAGEDGAGIAGADEREDGERGDHFDAAELERPEPSGTSPQRLRLKPGILWPSPVRMETTPRG